MERLRLSPRSTRRALCVCSSHQVRRASLPVQCAPTARIARASREPVSLTLILARAATGTRRRARPSTSPSRASAQSRSTWRARGSSVSLPPLLVRTVPLSACCRARRRAALRSALTYSSFSPLSFCSGEAEVRLPPARLTLSLAQQTDASSFSSTCSSGSPASRSSRSSASSYSASF